MSRPVTTYQRRLALGFYDAPSVGAVDFYVDGVDINKVQAWVDREWPYSVGYGAPKGFCHLGIRKGRPRVRWVY